MRNNKQFVIIICLITICQYQGFGQSNENQNISFEDTIIDSLYSESLGEQREIRIKLPEDFNPKNHKAYPVVYLLDGDVQLSTLETVYNNYWGHYLPNMILVGISNNTNRTRDLTTSQIKMRHGSAMNQETGGADNFTSFIEKELIPYIDNKYPTTPYRTLIGHSYGGLFTINTLINHAHLFENYIAIDPSLDWDNQKLLKQAREILQTEDFTGKSLFISLAAEQLHMQNEEISMENVMQDSSEFTLFARSIIDFSLFAESQKQNGLNFSWTTYPNDLHGTVPLPSMRDGLIFAFDWYQFKHPQKYNNPDTPIDELEELLKKQEEILTENFGYPVPPMIEELFIGYGYMYLQYELFEKSQMFFMMNIQYYPKSVSGYDAMVDYFETQNDSANALKYLIKAYEISGDDAYKGRIEELKK